MVGADVKPADIVTHDDEDVGLAPGRRGLGLRLGRLNRSTRTQCRRGGEGGTGKQHISTAQHALVIAFIIFDAHNLLPSRMTHRKPRWLVDVSTASAWRAAGR